MTLPAIGRVASLQAGGQDGAGIGASATSNSGVDEIDLGVFGVEDLDHGFETSSFTAARPPREYFHLIAGSLSTASQYNAQDQEHNREA